MTISCCKTLTSQKCKLCYQCSFRKIGDNYARDDKLCQHNLSKPTRRSATPAELCLRLTFSDVPWTGRTSKADMWIVSDCSLSMFVWIFLVQKWYRNTGLSTRRRRPVSDPCSRSHLPCGEFFLHFSLSFFFFSFQKKKSIKKSLTRYVGYLNCFRRLDKNGKTTEIHCMIASL